METIDQQVINDNKEIYAKIQSELWKAEFEILIATAWFTDEDLFNILLDRLAAGIHIEVIIADNQENEKLNFNLLQARGASVYRIKGQGYGGMNQKFCVIDKRLALHGSYNWSMNAKKNNQESIISTDHKETVLSLIKTFNDTKNRILSTKPDAETLTARPERPKAIPIEIPVKLEDEFRHILDSMIAAEVGSFDRDMLRKHGFERCQANKGDHQVLDTALDTLYSVFLNDIDVIEDKKKRLLTKIEEHRVKNIDNITRSSELEIGFLEKETELNQASLGTKRTNLEADIEITAKNIGELMETKIPFLVSKNEALDNQIKIAEREFLRPKFKWFDFIPTAIFNAALLVYLFFFYSSAAYILLFSVADAKAAEAQGISIAEAQIFNPDAVAKALHKSGSAPYFIFLFVFIPLAFAIMDRFVNARWVGPFSFIFGIFVLDSAVAFKVTQAVYDVNYSRGNVNVPWRASMAFTDTNFYLVFVFGAAGLFLFKYAFKKLMEFFEDRDPDIAAQRSQLLIKQLRAEVAGHEQQILALKEEAATLEKNIIQLKAEVKSLALELATLPSTLNQQLQKIHSQLITDSKMIDEVAAIYAQHIQSDNLPISVDALKDRINIFLEGWNDFLYEEFAVAKAKLKTREAADMATTWQGGKINTNKIDKRIKIN
jgi:hypothetical protein